MRGKRTLIRRIYEQLLKAYGPQHWWPAEGEDELIIGIVLTQNAAWSNVERALSRLKEAGACDLRSALSLPDARLAELIRPAGYFNLKTRRLKAVARYFIERWDCDYASMRRADPMELREELLGVYGLGRESVDCVLLYLLGFPVFVIDAYTLRIGARHGLFAEGASYEEARRIFESALPCDAAQFNEYHALLVQVGKHQCKPKPRCEGCPLNQRRNFPDPAALPGHNQR
ncbi:hypothetical protein JXA32_00700 [Candidatus Sumerlaeota bacterium]|nr:hypothetical protein [Candidatus Sumerlaeota bacterium]